MRFHGKSMSIELTITIKDPERTYKHKFLVYEDVTLSLHDPVVEKCVKEAIEAFDGEPEDIVLRAMMVLT